MALHLQGQPLQSQSQEWLSCIFCNLMLPYDSGVSGLASSAVWPSQYSGVVGKLQENVWPDKLWKKVCLVTVLIPNHHQVTSAPRMKSVTGSVIRNSECCSCHLCLTMPRFRSWWLSSAQHSPITGGLCLTRRMATEGKPPHLQMRNSNSLN